MDKLKAYKLDRAFTGGVDIRLDDAPGVVFKVRLPSEYNRPYMQAIYGDVDFSMDESGRVNPGKGLVKMKHSQEDAFVDHCILSMDGDPLPQGFIDDYPDAVKELWQKANELAADIDRKVDRSKKKSSSSLSGKSSGEEKKSSMESLSAQAG